MRAWVLEAGWCGLLLAGSGFAFGVGIFAAVGLATFAAAVALGRVLR